MWRSVALAIGILVTLAGAQCMVVEKMQLILQRPPETDFAASPLSAMQGAVSRPEVIEIPEWAPWSLLSVGIVMLLYSATMPKQG